MITIILFNYFLSFWKNKKYDLFKKKLSMEKVNIPQHGTKEMYGDYTFQKVMSFWFYSFVNLISDVDQKMM